MRIATKLLVVSLLLVTEAAYAKTWHVNQKGGEDFSGIGSAVVSASDGDTIEVKPGVYEEVLSLDGKILKLIAVEGPEKTTLTAATTILDIAKVGTAGTLIQGFRFEGAMEGAVHVSGSTVTVKGCVFEGNGSDGADLNGGALRVTGASQVLLDGCAFDGNHAASGGALYSDGAKLTLTDCRLSGNGAKTGGGIFADGSTLKITRTFFCSNVASEQGGGLLASTSTASVAASVFADEEGSALWLEDVYSDDGGAVSLSNLVVSGGTGGGIVLVGKTDVAVDSSVFTGIDGGAFVLMGSGAPEVSYSLLSGNSPADVVDGAGQALPSLEGSGLLTGDPGLVAPTPETGCGPGAYEPAVGSPLIDAGDPAVKDKDGSRSDIGAYGSKDGFEPVLDGDKDTVADLADNCPDKSNLDQKDTDGDGIGDVCDETSGVTDDKDKDGVKDAKDNCPNNYNPNQLDTDGDGKGDVCDDNDDGDPVPDIGDCKPTDPNVYPGKVEECNGYDDDCDDLVDEDLFCQEPEPDAGAPGEVDATTGGGGEIADGVSPGGGTVNVGGGGDSGGCSAAGGGVEVPGLLVLMFVALCPRRRKGVELS